MWLPADIITVPDIVRYWAARIPDAPMLTDERRSRSYSEVDARSNALAHALLDHGVVPGSHVGFLGPNSIEFWEIWFGVTKAGSAPAPLNWRFAVAELVELVEDAGLELLLVDDELGATAREVAARASRPVTVVTFRGGEPSAFGPGCQGWPGPRSSCENGWSGWSG